MTEKDSDFNIEKLRSELPIEEKVCCDVDDMIYDMKKMQKKYNLSWEKARDYTNASIKRLYEVKE